jgi:hypothetical protein
LEIPASTARSRAFVFLRHGHVPDLIGPEDAELDPFDGVRAAREDHLGLALSSLLVGSAVML